LTGTPIAAPSGAAGTGTIGDVGIGREIETVRPVRASATALARTGGDQVVGAALVVLAQRPQLVGRSSISLTGDS